MIQQDIPINLEITYEQFRLIVFFEILKPQKLMDSFGVEQNFDELLYGSKQTDDKQLFQVDVKQTVLIYILGLIGILILAGCAFIFRKYFTKVVEKVKSFIKSFYWNSTIQTIYVSYLPQTIGCFNQLSNLMWVKMSLNTVQLVIMIVLFVFSLLTPICFTRWLCKNKDQVRTKRNLADKYGTFYQGLKMPWKDIYQRTLYFYPVMLFRRLAFVIVCFFFHKQPNFQIKAVVVLHLAYLCWLVKEKPMISKAQNYIIIFNECALLLCGYFQMWLLTVENFFTSWNLGFAIIAVPFVVIIVNVIFISFEFTKDFLKRRFLTK